MEQIHRRLTDEQTRLVLRNYCEHHLSREEVEETLGIGKSQFFVLLKKYCADPCSGPIKLDTFSGFKREPFPTQLVSLKTNKSLHTQPVSGNPGMNGCAWSYTHPE
jgi:hypothetical protein